MVPPIIGENRAIRNIKTLISRVAPTGENILICGETGVGKDLVAQSLYHQSRRVGKPFVKVDCAILIDSLFETEISCFDQTGTEDASKKKSGLFEKISGGTLYLDNIDLLPSAHQSEVLSFLQNDEHPILDQKTPNQPDICVFSSTKQNLEKMVKEGNFNASLYFRLSTVRIDITPLRDRPEDIPLLIENYFKKYASAYNGHKMMALLDKSTIDKLCSYHWPGNIRELQNVLKRIIFTEDTVKNISDLIGTSKLGYKNVDDEKTKEIISHPNSFLDYFSMHASELTSLPLKKARKKIVDLAEKELISKALEKTSWNRSKANQILDISYKTLLSKIRELNIQPAEQRES
ncbi:MAG: sigma 54-interacting transcriptional regulator [Desulfobacteraceae bacterium]|jgi:DNA-binding NtrC family response regulator|nr:sigma 54-interacting transcriptional regulator [Desulfobacteraceae bacterium]MDH3955981.1 sigma 54-interacting transcriptional regulator [Desulfobacteraceae bacterium]